MALTDTDFAPPAHPSTRSRLLSGVAVATLAGVAGVAVFGLFYVVGAVIGLAALAVGGVLLLVGLARLATKARRNASASS
ncbi:MAG: hypothetical protein BGN86_13200 [Caulobacterales bacterium 68-7]|nr:hypothetical protein [Caulobacterales bacterium]OJU13306.1 MAG: hypothetical protein BGN86_13200 [Caulobacterales bacterium 68-7]